MMGGNQIGLDSRWEWLAPNNGSGRGVDDVEPDATHAHPAGIAGARVGREDGNQFT